MSAALPLNYKFGTSGPAPITLSPATALMKDPDSSLFLLLVVLSVLTYAFQAPRSHIRC